MDMIHPKEPDKITLNDIKRSGVASPFFNMLFSWQRFLEDEQHHPLKMISSPSFKENDAFDTYSFHSSY
jgi:hypothetical protein